MRDIDVDPWSLTTEQLVVYLGSQSWQASTKRTYRASLRAFYAWAQATGRRADNPAALTPEITVPKKLPRPVPEAVLRDAIAAADDRVRLMLLLAATCGLRRGELARARLEDIVADLAGFSLVVHGKGRKQRLVPLPDGLAAVLRQLPPGYLFTSRAWGRAGAPLSPARVGELVSEVLPPGWTCHTLRHRCATVAYAATKDLRAVQELLGHSKPETTMVYTLIHEDSVRAAMTAATTFGDVA
ncbi:tyrosine-type recombinase/integrase [Nocardioides hankookensis]|uniref:Tyrosine-type recombinase/integrase n=1 Tax=Nocardioides hankookensis TaxID=443157 RepID=A0ABW1LR58_9ACTN